MPPLLILLALPIFPCSRPQSIVVASELNFRVRDGNGWTLTAISTDCSILTDLSAKIKYFIVLLECPHSRRSGTPSGTRTLDTLIKSQVLYQLS